jgi:hypothetical protein
MVWLKCIATTLIVTVGAYFLTFMIGGGKNPWLILPMAGRIRNFMRIGLEETTLKLFLQLVKNVILSDPAYIARLKRHYQIFKEKVDPKKFLPSTVHLKQIDNPIIDDAQGKMSASPSTKPRKRSRRRAN